MDFSVTDFNQNTVKILLVFSVRVMLVYLTKLPQAHITHSNYMSRIKEIVRHNIMVYYLDSDTIADK